MPKLLLFGPCELVVLLLFVLFVIALVKLASSSKRSAPVRQNEARAIQELNKTLEHMEDRVESLETLLIERARK